MSKIFFIYLVSFTVFGFAMTYEEKRDIYHAWAIDYAYGNEDRDDTWDLYKQGCIQEAIDACSYFIEDSYLTSEQRFHFLIMRSVFWLGLDDEVQHESDKEFIRVLCEVNEDLFFTYAYFYRQLRYL